MKLYLVQHGEARPKEVDPERPLSEAGVRDVQRIAAFLADAEIGSVTDVFESGKRRATQTAEILASVLAPGVAPRAVSGIAPMDPTTGLDDRLQTVAGDTLVAGHQPFMGKLVSRLLSRAE